MSQELTQAFTHTLGEMTAAINSLADSQKKQADVNDAIYKIIGAGETKQKSYEQKHNFGVPASTAEHRPLHEDAFWRDCNMSPRVINRLIAPLDTVMNLLPSFGTIVADKKFGYLTNNTISQLQGTVPTNGCEPCRTLTNEYSGCKVELPMGRSCVRAQTLESNELFRRACLRLVADDVYIEGNFSGFIGGDGGQFTEQMQDRDFLVAGAVKRQLWRMGRYLQDWDARAFWDGNPTGDPIDAREYWGVSSLIRADYDTMTPATGPAVEAGGTLTGVSQANSCLQLNADLKDFNLNCIGGAVNLLYWLETLEHNIYMTARGIGALPATWALVMTSEHWAEISRYLPCMKAFMDCGSGNSLNPQTGDSSVDRVTLDGATIINERDRLRESGIIMLNGRAYPVYIDDYQPYTTSTVTINGQDRVAYDADIWFMPLTAFGGIPVMYFEHMDYSQISRELSPITQGQIEESLSGYNDGGKFHTILESQNYCWALQTKFEKRLVTQCTSISGRLLNVRACPLQASPRGIIPGQLLGTGWGRSGITATAPAP